MCFAIQAMEPGSLVKMKSSALAVSKIDGAARSSPDYESVSIPSGVVIRVIAVAERFVTVEWQGREVLLPAADLEAKAEIITAGEQ